MGIILFITICIDMNACQFLMGFSLIGQIYQRHSRILLRKNKNASMLCFFEKLRTLYDWDVAPIQDASDTWKFSIVGSVVGIHFSFENTMLSLEVGEPSKLYPTSDTLSADLEVAAFPPPPLWYDLGCEVFWPRARIDRQRVANVSQKIIRIQKGCWRCLGRKQSVPLFSVFKDFIFDPFF